MSNGELIIYQTEDGLAQINLRATEGTVWLTQNEMAELFDSTKQNVSLHLKNIFADRELVEDSVVKESLTTASDGKQYLSKLYNLDAILSVGFRVRSPLKKIFADHELEEDPVIRNFRITATYLLLNIWLIQKIATFYSTFWQIVRRNARQLLSST